MILSRISVSNQLNFPSMTQTTRMRDEAEENPTAIDRFSTRGNHGWTA